MALSHSLHHQSPVERRQSGIVCQLPKRRRDVLDRGERQRQSLLGQEQAVLDRSGRY